MEPGKDQIKKQENVPVEASDYSPNCKGTTKINLVSEAEKEFIFNRIMNSMRLRGDQNLQKRTSPPVQIAVLKPGPLQGSHFASANLTVGEVGEEEDAECEEKAKEITRIIRERLCREGLSLGESSSSSQANKLAERLKMVTGVSEDVGLSATKEIAAKSSNEQKLENLNLFAGMNGKSSLLKDSKPEKPQAGSSSEQVVCSDSAVAEIPHHAIEGDGNQSGDPSSGSSDELEFYGFEEEVLEQMRNTYFPCGSKLRGQGVCHLLSGCEDEEEMDWGEAIDSLGMEIAELMLGDMVAQVIGYEDQEKMMEWAQVMDHAEALDTACTEIVESLLDDMLAEAIGM